LLLPFVLLKDRRAIEPHILARVANIDGYPAGNFCGDRGEYSGRSGPPVNPRSIDLNRVHSTFFFHAIDVMGQYLGVAINHGNTAIESTVAYPGNTQSG
jgi:hypothetical protein